MIDIEKVLKVCRFKYKYETIQDGCIVFYNDNIKKKRNKIRKIFELKEVEEEEKIKKMITTNYYSSAGELIKTVTEIEYED